MSAKRPTGERGQRLTYLVKRLEMAERARMEEVLRPLGVTLHLSTYYRDTSGARDGAQ